ncbi:hypothetical protein [Nitrobacter sp.]|uniref:hypothetical protein n=1 Tax=Nitrobacter sp. TaxID=29420 RepID=UPI0029CAB060|nr:hypothetical protein [Nitrobacter sp.]
MVAAGFVPRLMCSQPFGTDVSSDVAGRYSTTDTRTSPSDSDHRDAGCGDGQGDLRAPMLRKAFYEAADIYERKAL